MKRGTIVAVCHDGKWGRRVKGVVTVTRRGHHIKVEFPHPETEQPVEFWAKVLPTVHHRRTKQSGKYNSMITLANYKCFGGWADIDYWCPWYAVYKWAD